MTASQGPEYGSSEDRDHMRNPFSPLGVEGPSTSLGANGHDPLVLRTRTKQWLSSALRIGRIAGLSGAAKVPGFLVPLTIAHFFGANSATDSYFLAYNAILFAGASVGSALSVASVPFAARAIRESRDSARNVLRHLTRQALLWGAATGAVGGLLLCIGLSVALPAGGQAAYTLLLYGLLIPLSIAACASGAYVGALTASFALESGAISSVFRGLGAIAGILVGHAFHLLWPVAVGLSAGECFRALWLRWRWQRISLSLPANGASENVKGFFSAAGHQVATEALGAAFPLLERFLVGTIAVAAISHIEYSYKLLMAVAVLFDGGIAPFLLARWSRLHAERALLANWEQVQRPLVLAASTALLVAAGIAVGAPTLVRLLLGHGAFRAADAAAVATLLRRYAAGFAVNMTNTSLERLLLARGRNDRLFRLGLVRQIARLSFLVPLLHPWGLVAVPSAYLGGELVYLAFLWPACMRPRPGRIPRMGGVC